MELMVTAIHNELYGNNAIAGTHPDHLLVYS